MTRVECWYNYFWDRQACNNSAAYLFLPHIASILTTSGFGAGCYPPRYTPRMKIEGHGEGKILTQEEIELLFNEGLQTDRARALFGVCLYTACRIAEACSLKVIDVFTPAGVIRSEMIIRFRQHQRQAWHPHYPDHSRIEAAVRNLRASRTPLPIPQPPPQPPLEAREPGSRLSPIPRSLRKSWHHRRFHPQPQKVSTHSDEQRGYPIADYSRNQRPPQLRTVAEIFRSAARPSEGSRLCTIYPFARQKITIS